jgi:putative oxidoreductase
MCIIAQLQCIYANSVASEHIYVLTIMINSIESALARYSHLAPTALRVALGTVFLAHAYGKAAIFTFAGTEAYFQANGFPGWTVYPVFIAEIVLGLALILGYRTRLAALALIPVMLGAIKPHLGNGWMFSSNGGGWEYPAFLIVMLVVQAALGSGSYGIDTLKSVVLRNNKQPA